MDESGRIVDYQDSGQGWAGKAELAWAALAFAEPIMKGPRIEPLKIGGRIEPEQEITLYSDWQTRDSELGLGLIDRRKFELLMTTVMLRNGLERRLRAASVVRTRYQALKTINAGEPNPALRYPEKVFSDLQVESSKLTAEVTYLHGFSTRVESLHRLLTQLLNAPEGNLSPELEQILRLLGQSWRGSMRIKAWNERVPKGARTRPALTVFQPDYMNFSGYIVSVTSIDGSIILSEDTVGYLIGLLEVISNLARETERYLSDRASAQNAADTWYPINTMLRSIVEFFYFCNFELPYAYGHLVLDGVASDKIWTYRDRWVAGRGDETSMNRLKRMSGEIVSLLIKQDRLLKCETEAELTELLKVDALPMGNAPVRMLYQPYRAVGLANFEFTENEQRVRFYTPVDPIGDLISSLLIDQPHLANLASSQLGGPLETLLGLALLDERAFSSPVQLDTRIRYEQLARFWRSVGRRRAIIMLGERYIQSVSEALSSLGQPGPEHPTFLTVRFGTPAPETQFDPFSALVLADQVRLIELLNITWSFGEKFFERLRVAEETGNLKDAINSLPSLAAAFEGELRLRLNESWLISLDRIWALLRSSAPVLWDFWGKLKNEENWTEPIMSAPAPEAAGLMLRLFGDSLRLITLIELSGTMMLTRLRYSSEQGERALYCRALPYQAADPERASAISQVVDYYFDAEFHFDPALAFASAFYKYLVQMLEDLKTFGADEKQCALFASAISQLDQSYGLGKD
jgi:hypothetical protein